jgi:hypothetical protein
MCAAAKAKAKAQPKTRISASYFGKRPREVRSEQESRQRQAKTQRMALLDDSALSLQLLDMAAGKQTLGEFVKQVRAAQRAQHAARAVTRKQELRTLAEYRKTIAPAKIKELEESGAVPGSCFVALPSDDGMQRFKCNARFADAAGKVCAVSALQSGKDKFGASLEQWWLRHHEPYQENVGSAALGIEDKTIETSACRREGFCVHQGVGKELYRFRHRFFLKLKLVFKPNTDARLLLRDSFVVARFRGEHLRTGDEAIRFYHIGLPIFNPYRVMLLQLQQAPDPCELDPKEGRLYVSEIGIFQEDYLAMETFPRQSMRWTVKFYIVEELESPCDYMAPNPIPIVEYTEARDEFQFWNAARGARAAGLDLVLAGYAALAGCGLAGLEDGEEDADAPLPEPICDDEPVDEEPSALDELFEDLADALADPSDGGLPAFGTCTSITCFAQSYT